MRLAFLTTCGYPWGGSEGLWTAAARAALRDGHEVLASVFDWPRQHEAIGELAAMGARLQLRRRFFPAPLQRIRKKLVNRFRPATAQATYHDYLSDFRPAHLLFNLAGGDEIAIDPDDLLTFVRQTDIPFSVMYHAVTPGFVYPEDVAANMRFIFQRSRHSLFTSRLQADLYRQQTADPIRNARVVHHPLRPIRPRPYPDPGAGPVRFCMIGSLIQRWKGQDIALDVLSAPRWQARDWLLDIYGSGEDAADLEVRAQRSGIGGRVRFRGNDPDIGAVLGEHHLVLIPSRQDTGPIVLFEAMRAARPVVGTPMGAMPDHVSDGATGFLSATIDVDGFGDALERAWEVRGAWRRLGEAAAAQLAAQYDAQPERTLLNLMTG
jgi:glycosyltransferase involved in cell wall biosynthesis